MYDVVSHSQLSYKVTVLYENTTPSGLKYLQHFFHVTFLIGQIPKPEKTT